MTHEEMHEEAAKRVQAQQDAIDDEQAIINEIESS
jgi:hypothetical protein